MRPIVSFDMDMTLLDHENFEIPDSAMKALDMLRERYVVVVATGRDMDGHYSRKFKDLVKPDAIVHTNGTKVTVGDIRILYGSGFKGAAFDICRGPWPGGRRDHRG